MALTFPECVRECFANRQLLLEFDRLKGTNLSLKGNGLEILIDEASGRWQHDVEEFVSFVRDCVWDRL